MNPAQVPVKMKYWEKKLFQYFELASMQHLESTQAWTIGKSHNQ